MSDERGIGAREAVGTYAASQIAGASPGQLVLILYDYTIGCCRRADAVNARRGLVELMSALDLTYLDVAGPLYRVYEYLLEQVRGGDFSTALPTLEELRTTWTEVLVRAGTAPAPREWSEA